MTGRGRIALYAPYLYPIASGDGNAQFAGGTEVRQWALARALAKRGFEVTIATCNFGQPPLVVHERVSLVRTYALHEGIPGIRLLYPRFWRAVRTLVGVGAQVYMANGAGIATGWAYDAAKLSRARFVFLASSDYDALPNLPFLQNRREKWWYLRALRGADARVAQTQAQSRLFLENFHVHTSVIPNPAELPSTATDAAANEIVLWLSTYKPHKRPEWFVELARRLPHVKFVMVGAIPDFGRATNEWELARLASRDCANLEVHSFVEHQRIKDFLSRAALFVHTSPAEGFPMTLLEAWSYGVPTVSCVDPADAVTTHQLGEVASTLEDLTSAVRTLMGDPVARGALGVRARRYVQHFHGPESTYEPLASLLDHLICNSSGARRNRRASR